MHVRQYFTEVYQIATLIDCEMIERIVDALVELRARNGRLFLLGVGGSAANCIHAANDFRKLCEIEAYTAVDNVAELTARINDDGWEAAFTQWLQVSRISERDAIFVFSVGGGNVERNISVNLVRAVDEAKRHGLKVFGIVGRQDGHVKQMGDAVIVIPTVNAAHVTAHTEAFQAAVWHCFVTHPKLQRAPMKWEGLREDRPRTKIRAVAFDLEGTVVNVEAAHHEAHRAAARDAGLELSIDDCFMDLPHFIGGPDEDVAKEIAVLANADWTFILERKRFHYRRIIESGGVKIEPRPGFLQAIQWIQDHGIAITMGTAMSRSQAELLLSRSGLSTLFDASRTVFLEDVENPKPSPEVFLKTAGLAGVHPSEQLVFEDSSRGIKAAVEAGSIAIGMPVYHRPEAIIPLLQAGAKRIFLEWSEINFDKLFLNLG